MPTISDDEMRQMMTTTKPYTVIILKATPKLKEAGMDKVVWEHGRRNFELRAEGKLAVVMPIRDGSDVSGVGIFNATVEETQALMDGDPGVQAGIFTYEVHASRSFPGDSLPG
ncbi:MAG TPA: hypothetical protein VHD90_24160 [Phototrophicaceae bacterium]|nr:hypothetical protein [Phototrophicaceae bacterium]